MNVVLCVIAIKLYWRQLANKCINLSDNAVALHATGYCAVMHDNLIKESFIMLFVCACVDIKGYYVTKHEKVIKNNLLHSLCVDSKGYCAAMHDNLIKE